MKRHRINYDKKSVACERVRFRPGQLRSLKTQENFCCNSCPIALESNPQATGIEVPLWHRARSNEAPDGFAAIPIAAIDRPCLRLLLRSPRLWVRVADENVSRFYHSFTTAPHSSGLRSVAWRENSQW